MFVTLSGIATFTRLMHPLKASSPMLFTPVFIVTVSKSEQPSNAPEPISATLPGISIASSFVHPLKALAPMLDTLFPIVTFLRLVQPKNA